jgi:Icc-related predicted phosphoesterase
MEKLSIINIIKESRMKFTIISKDLSGKTVLLTGGNEGKNSLSSI